MGQRAAEAADRLLKRARRSAAHMHLRAGGGAAGHGRACALWCGARAKRGACQEGGRRSDLHCAPMPGGPSHPPPPPLH